MTREGSDKQAKRGFRETGSTLLKRGTCTAGLLSLVGLFTGVVFGLPPIDGHDPSQPIGGEFTPTEYLVVYLKFRDSDASHRLTVRHAFFEVSTQQNDADTLTLRDSNRAKSSSDEIDNAKDNIDCALNYLASDGGQLGQCRVIEKEGHEPIGYDFKKIAFDGQSRIYVYIENEDIGFNEVTPISFTPYGAFDKPGRWPWNRKTNVNWSFGGADFVKRTEADEKKILVFENHYKKLFGRRINKENDRLNYSINFNLRMCTVASHSNGSCDFNNKDEVIPIVVDPDTSNGRGGRG